SPPLSFLSLYLHLSFTLYVSPSLSLCLSLCLRLSLSHSLSPPLSFLSLYLPLSFTLYLSLFLSLSLSLSLSVTPRMFPLFSPNRMSHNIDKRITYYSCVFTHTHIPPLCLPLSFHLS